MSGSTIGGIVGGVVGLWTGVGWQAGWMAGSAIGGMIDPDVIKAPSIGDAQRQTSQAGVPRPVVYGHPAPFAGNLIDGEAKARKIIVEEEQGKGGPVVESERFLLTYAVRICEGPAKVLRAIRNGEVVYDVRALDEIPTFEGGSAMDRLRYVAEMRAKSIGTLHNTTFYEGTETQLPDPALEALHGVGNTPYYRGTCYMVVVDDDVTDMRGAAAQWQFEVVKSGVPDAGADIVPDGGVWGHGLSGSVSPGQIHSSEAVRSLSHIRGVFRLVATPTYPGPTRARVYSGDLLVYDTGWILDFDYQDELSGAVNSIAYWLKVNDNVGIVDTAVLAALKATLGDRMSHSGPTHSAPIPTGLYTDLRIECFQLGNSSGQSGISLQIQYPDPAALPETVSYLPELDVLLGSDGVMYWPSWNPMGGLNIISSDSVVLGSVLADIADRCGVPGEKLDVSTLTDVIPGLLVAEQYTGADTIRPLQQGFFFDMPEVDGKLRAVRRGGPIVAEVTDDDRVDADEPQEVIRAQVVEYPLKVSVVTQDPAAEYAAVPQTSGRASPDFLGSSEVTIQLPIPFGADDSARIAHKLHKVLHAQAEGRVELELPDSFSHVVPGDAFAYRGRRWLLEDARYADGVVHWKAVYDRASAYVSTVAGVRPRAPGLPSSGLRGPTNAAVMDLPIWRDADDGLGVYVAASGTFDGWNGARLLVSTDDGASFSKAVDIVARARMGTTTTGLAPLASAEYPGEQTLTVKVNGNLESTDRAGVLRYANRAAVQLASGGWEILQFQDADDNGDGTWTLSGLLRGRYNTTPGTIASGASFVLLTDAVRFVPLQPSMLGKTLQFKAVSFGADPAGVEAASFAVPAVPASVAEWPVHRVRTATAGGDLQVTWIGRARLGTDTAPQHSRHFAGYRVTFAIGGTAFEYDTTAQAFTYTAAQQTADWGAPQGSYTVTVRPVSSLVAAGTGDPGTGTPPDDPGAPEQAPLTVSGALPPAYVGVPYYNATALGDPWRVTGGDYPRIMGELPAGLTYERGTSSRLAANVYGVPLEEWTGDVTTEIDGVPYVHPFTVLPRPDFGVLDFARRRESSGVAMVDAHTVRFDSAGGILGLVGATSGLLRAEVTVDGPAWIGVHAASLDNTAVRDNGNPAGTFARWVTTPGTYAVELDAAAGKVWISDAAGAFTGSPAAGTAPDATIPLAYSTDGRYRLAVNGAAGTTAVANFGNSAWTHAASAGFGGWPLSAAAVPVVWTTTGATHAQVASALGQVPTATVAGLLDAARTAPASGTFGGLRGTIGKSTGKWQFQIRPLADVPFIAFGIAQGGFDFAEAMGADGTSVAVAHAALEAGTRRDITEVRAHGSATQYEQLAGAVYTFAFDADAGVLEIHRNGTLLQAVSGLPAGTWFPALSTTWRSLVEIRGTNLDFPVATFNDWTVTP